MQRAQHVLQCKLHNTTYAPLPLLEATLACCAASVSVLVLTMASMGEGPSSFLAPAARRSAVRWRDKRPPARSWRPSARAQSVTRSGFWESTASTAASAGTTTWRTPRCSFASTNNLDRDAYASCALTPLTVRRQRSLPAGQQQDAAACWLWHSCLCGHAKRDPSHECMRSCRVVSCPGTMVTRLAPRHGDLTGQVASSWQNAWTEPGSTVAARRTTWQT